MLEQDEEEGTLEKFLNSNLNDDIDHNDTTNMIDELDLKIKLKH